MGQKHSIGRLSIHTVDYRPPLFDSFTGFACFNQSALSSLSSLFVFSPFAPSLPWPSVPFIGVSEIGDLFAVLVLSCFSSLSEQVVEERIGEIESGSVVFLIAGDGVLPEFADQS